MQRRDILRRNNSPYLLHSFVLYFPEYGIVHENSWDALFSMGFLGGGTVFSRWSETMRPVAPRTQTPRDMNSRVRDGIAGNLDVSISDFDFFGDDRIYQARIEPWFSPLQGVIAADWGVLGEWPWLLKRLVIIFFQKRDQLTNTVFNCLGFIRSNRALP